MNPLIISLAAFLGATMLVVGIAALFGAFNASKAEDRLAVMTGRKPRDAEAEGIIRDELFPDAKAGLAGLFNKLYERLGRMSRLFQQANSPVRPEVFFGLTAGCAVLGFVAMIVTHSPVPLYPLGGLMGSSLPMIWLLMRRRRRFKKFAKQLPDALELIARALRSGHSLASGMHVVVEEMPDPIAMEFGQVYEEQNLGVGIEQALKTMLVRMPNLDLKFFVTAVAIQKQAGGDMAEILDKIGYIIRERFKIMGQVQALTGEGRISGVVLMALPIALFFAVYYLNPDYVMLLFTEAVGRKMIAVAVVLQILGAITIKKIVNIKI
jgi:tight adherence protein B